MTRIKSKGKAAKYYQSVKEERFVWARSKKQLCMACGALSGYMGLEIHEIERRAHAPDNWAHWSNYLLLCGPCHSGPFASMPHSRQLAYKFLADGDDFHLMHWLRLKDPLLRAPNRVTMDEVLAWVEVITSEQALGINR
jgi:hypothetical protein